MSSTFQQKKQQEIYYQMIINLLIIQQAQIVTSLQNYTTITNSIKNLIGNVSLSETPIFSRLITDVSQKCNFCNKTSYYQDMENKLYCWFHRSQFEEE